MKQHTSEPWVQVGDFVAAESDQLNGGEYVCGCFGPDQEANARRIVACVNFCAGISTENLEGNEKLLWLAEQYNAVKSQREALQAVIGELLDRGLFFSSAIESGDDDIDFKDWESRARSAIAKDKGGDA